MDAPTWSFPFANGVCHVYQSDFEQPLTKEAHYCHRRALLIMGIERLLDADEYVEYCVQFVTVKTLAVQAGVRGNWDRVRSFFWEPPAEAEAPATPPR